MLRPHLTSQFLHFYVCQYVVRSGEICGAILYHLFFLRTEFTEVDVNADLCVCVCVCV
jgi:hypothetical protein